MYRIHALEEYLNLYNTNQQMHVYKTCFIKY